jgi:ribose transport system permease protein
VTGSTPAVESEPAEEGRLAPEHRNRVLAMLSLSSPTARRQALLVGLFVVMVAAFSIADAEHFLTWTNFKNAANQVPVLMLLAVGVTAVLRVGEFDLAAPAIAALVSGVAALLATQASGFDTGGGVLLAMAVGIAVGGLVGATSGVSVAYGKAPSFVVTLAVSSVALGLELLVQSKITGGLTQISAITLPDTLRDVAGTKILGLSLSLYIALGLSGVVWLLLSRTAYGRHAHATGGNESAAQLAGVSVNRIKIIAFVISGLLAGVAGIVLVSQQGYLPNATASYLLQAYAAAFFGATAVGKRGFSVPATLFGVIFLATLSNGLAVLNQPLWISSTIQGAVLLFTVMLSRSRT